MVWEIPEIFHKDLLEHVKICDNNRGSVSKGESEDLSVLLNVVAQKEMNTVEFSGVEGIADERPWFWTRSVDFLENGLISCALPVEV